MGREQISQFCKSWHTLTLTVEPSFLGLKAAAQAAAKEEEEILMNGDNVMAAKFSRLIIHISILTLRNLQ